MKMDVRDMQDREVYERGFEGLLDKLGHTGTMTQLENRADADRTNNSKIYHNRTCAAMR